MVTPAPPPDNNNQQKPLNVVTPDYQTQIDLMVDVVDNMLSRAKKRIMIGGATGLGKSSFVKQFAKVFGFPSIIVEIPHVVEEQMINIPFVIFDKNGQSSQGYDTLAPQKEGTAPRVELGTSYLATKLAQLTKLTDREYTAKINTYDSSLKGLIKQFEEQNPGTIAKVRQRYNRILFLDEYFRQTTPAIRNILRNVLNDRIGNDVVPPGTYVMYASNLEDVAGSIDVQSAHTTFLQKKFKAPTKSQWLQYTINQILEKNINVKQDVVDAFDQALGDEHVSYNDLNLEIRISPRRWSDIFVYINNAFPFKSPDELGILKTTIKRQFQSDKGETSDLYNVVDAMLARLATKSNIDPKKVKDVSPEKWRQILAQQVMTVVETQGLKKYIPVIQGLPGVGKTAIGETFEEPPYNMRFIPILATTLSRDSVVGIPLPDQEDKKIGVEFAKPELAILIEDQIKVANESYFQELQDLEKSGELNGKTARQVYQEFQNQSYKYMIFIDEINRVKDVAIFNSLRRLILEKEFNDQYKLPKGSVVIAAMNPSDLGTIPMTAHFRDAIDLIDVEPNWRDTVAFIKNLVIPDLKRSNNSSDMALNTALQIVEEFPINFALSRRRAAKEFYISIGGDEEIYLSPRDYDNLYKELVEGINRVTESLKLRIQKGKKFAPEEINSEIIKVAFNKFETTFDDLFYKAGMETPPGWNARMSKFLQDTVNVSMQMKTTQVGLTSLLNDVISDTTKLTDDIDFDNYMTKYSPAIFQKEFEEYLSQMFKNSDQIEEPVENLKKIVSQIKEAVDQNGFNRDILGKIENAIHTIMKETSKNKDQNDVMYLATLYTDLLDMLDLDV
jgi:MoxR-like ATPase